MKIPYTGTKGVRMGDLSFYWKRINKSKGENNNVKIQ